MDQVASVTASGVDDAHGSGNISAQNLIEYIDVDLPKLLLDAQSHTDPVPVHCGVSRENTLVA
jgi:hypothetical protein